jgi:hypothetical protein
MAVIAIVLFPDPLAGHYLIGQTICIGQDPDLTMRIDGQGKE